MVKNFYTTWNFWRTIFLVVLVLILLVNAWFFYRISRVEECSKYSSLALLYLNHGFYDAADKFANKANTCIDNLPKEWVVV